MAVCSLRTMLLAVSIMMNGFSADAQRIRLAEPVRAIGPAAQADVVGEQKKKFESERAVLLDEIDRVCDLSEVQKKKLKLATKGAIAGALKAWKVEVRKFQKQYGQIVGAVVVRAGGVPNNDEDEDTDDKEADEEDEDELKLDQRTQSMLQTYGISVSVPSQSLWRKSLRSVLTDDQEKKLETARAERRRFRRNFNVRQQIETLDRRLRFSPKQREQLMLIVDQVMGDWLEQEVPQGRMSVVYGDVPELLETHIEPVLSEKQLEMFREDRQDQNNPARRVMQMNFRQVVRNMGMGGEAFLGVAVRMNAFTRGSSPVDFVTPDGPAAKAGVKAGDHITKVGGAPLTSPTMVMQEVSQMKPGDKLKITVQRGDEELELEAELTKRPK